MSTQAATFARLRGEGALQAGEVHVWQSGLDQPAERTKRYAGILSPDERDRAARFHFDRDRDRFVAGRGLLREIIGLYQGLAPEQVEFRYGPLGKPALVGRGGEPLRFNVSHSGGVGLFAFSRDRELGIDVEYMRPLTDADEIADRFFSPREAAALKRLPAADRRRGFFACWTRKEAYLKATGGGLAAGLDRFAVSLGATARLEWIDGRPEEASRWWLSALDPEADYAGAIAVEGPSEPVLSWYGVPARAARTASDTDLHSLTPQVDWRRDGREGRQEPLQGRREPRGAVLDLARGARERPRMA